MQQPKFQMRYPPNEQPNMVQTIGNPSGISDSEYHIGKPMFRPSTTEDLEVILVHLLVLVLCCFIYLLVVFVFEFESTEL